ncbi:MAG: helix-turn-helix transcriptional regulator [Acidobacteria bacterium]|nr:helix-turn-helix transcriptional regulator [Acidobacteriota bacterium]
MTLKTPPPLGHALTLLRSVLGWGQKELAAAIGTTSSMVSDYERGQKHLSREKLEEIVRAMGLPPAAIGDALDFLEKIRSHLRAPVPQDGAAQADRQRIDRVALESAKAMADFTRSLLTSLTVEGQALAARQQARVLWERLRSRPPAKRRTLVEETPELRTWALCELLCAESIKAAADDADRAVELADLAWRIADLAPGEQTWRWRLQGYAWAHVGNARRVKGDLPGADEAFGRSGQLWAAGAPGDPGLLDEAVVLSLEVSLRIEQELLPAASALLDRALAADKGSLKKNLLVQKARLLEWSGDYEGAISALQQVAPLISEMEEPRLLWVQRFNLGTNLCHVGWYQQANALLPELQRLTALLGNGLDSLRVRWLEGRIASGFGRMGEAVEILSQVRAELGVRVIAYDAALATLELSVLFLQQGRTADVKVLVRPMMPVFQTHGVHKEALAALKLFCQAAEREAVTVELARRLVDYLYRARHNPGLRFEAGE